MKPSLVFKPCWLLFSCCMKLKSWVIYVIFTPSTQRQFASRLIFNNLKHRYGIGLYWHHPCKWAIFSSEKQDESPVFCPRSIQHHYVPYRAVIATGWAVFWNPPFPALQVSCCLCAEAEKQKRLIYQCYAFSQRPVPLALRDTTWASMGVRTQSRHLCGCFYALLCCSASAVWFKYLHFVHFCDLFASTCSHLRPSHC